MEKTEKQYKRLNAEERATIMLMTREGKGVREVGRFLNRSPSTISRETDRDFGVETDYDASRAGEQASHVRPPEVTDRLIPGHWEADMIKGAMNRSSVGTLVERTTLMTALARMPDGTAQSALDGFSEALSAIPSELRKTLTYDQGREMSKHAQLTLRTGVAVYFCDPHSPWQRGLNENTNGLLRQYLPKGSDLSVYSQEQLDEIAWSLNTRPRKSLGFRSPVEVYNERPLNMEPAKTATKH